MVNTKKNEAIMKKTFFLFSAMAMLLCGLIFTGCNEDDDDFFGPSNTWCEAPITKTNDAGEKTIIGYLNAIYCDEDYTSTETKTNCLKKGTTLKAGITVLIRLNPDATEQDNLTGTVLSGLSKNKYIMKTFEKDTETETGDGEQKVTIKGSKGLWKAAYIFNDDLHDSDAQLDLPKAPAPVCNSSSYEDVTETLKDFSWKTLLKEYLISTL